VGVGIVGSHYGRGFSDSHFCDPPAGKYRDHREFVPGTRLFLVGKAKGLIRSASGVGGRHEKAREASRPGIAAVGGQFPTQMKGFPQARMRTSRGDSGKILLGNGNKGVSGMYMFALAGNLCYSNEAVDEQWSLPVAVWPAPVEIGREGSGKLVRWVGRVALLHR